MKKRVFTLIFALCIPLLAILLRMYHASEKPSPTPSNETTVLQASYTTNTGLPAATVTQGAIPVSSVPSPSPMLQVTPSPAVPATKGTVPNQSKSAPFPILCYHAVSDQITGIPELFVSPAEFDAQLAYLKKNNYDILTFEDVPHIDQYPKPIILSFDDGYENNFTEAYPILKKYQAKAVIFLVNDYVDKPLYLKSEQIKQMGDIISFQSHTATHPELTSLSDEKLATELSDPIPFIQNLTGKPVNTLAYPIGKYNAKVVAATKNKYTYAVTTDSGLTNLKSSPHKMNRVYIPRGTNLTKFEKRLKQGYL